MTYCTFKYNDSISFSSYLRRAGNFLFQKLLATNCTLEREMEDSRFEVTNILFSIDLEKEQLLTGRKKYLGGTKQGMVAGYAANKLLSVPN